MNILFSSSPDFADIALLEQKCDWILSNKQNVEIQIPGVKGVVKPFMDYCKRRGIPYKVQQADFAGWGNAAYSMLYDSMVDTCSGFLFFWNGKTTNWAERFEKRIKTHVVRYKGIKEQLEEAKAALPKGAKKPKVHCSLTKEQKQLYIEAHNAWQERSTPEAVKDHGYTATQMPRGTTNGITTFLCNYFNWNGHHMERISNQGVYRGGKFTKGGGTNGTTDCSGHFNRPGQFAIPVKIEIKTGRDTMSKDQEWFAAKMERTGAIHAVVGNFDDVFKVWGYLQKL